MDFGSFLIYSSEEQIYLFILISTTYDSCFDYVTLHLKNL